MAVSNIYISVLHECVVFPVVKGLYDLEADIEKSFWPEAIKQQSLW